MLEEAITMCTHQNKRPTFFDELKIRLPHSPSPTANILFSFYNIDCKVKKKKKEAKAPNVYLPQPTMLQQQTNIKLTNLN